MARFGTGRNGQHSGSPACFYPARLPEEVVGRTNAGGMNIFLTEPNQRKATQQEIYDKLTRIYKRFPEARIIPNQEQTISTSLSAGSQLPVQFVLQNLDFDKLRKFIPLFLDEARKDSVFDNVDVNLKFNKPSLILLSTG